MAGVIPQVAIDDNSVQARLHKGKGGAYLWVVNQTRSSRKVRVSLANAAGEYRSAEDLWGKQQAIVDGRQIRVEVGARDAAVLALRA